MEIVDYPHAEQLLNDGELNDWSRAALSTTRELLATQTHGDVERWLTAIRQLPDLAQEQLDLSLDAITTGPAASPEEQAQIRNALMQLHPWRKGPFDLHGVYVDTEWRSSLKWDRLVSHLAPLQGRRVLDIGCGNGYYLWRLIGAGARCAIGVDPTQLFLTQFQAVRHFVGAQLPVTVLPLGIEHIPYLPVFDTVLSMGVIYHRRDPMEYIRQLLSLLNVGGQLVIETLIIESEHPEVLHPADRYAQMRNVWNIPSTPQLLRWLQECGLEDARIVDITPTRTDEQRATGWMNFQSLQDFLNPDDPSKTIEGYPAPIRAIATATKP